MKIILFSENVIDCHPFIKIEKSDLLIHSGFCLNELCVHTKQELFKCKLENEFVIYNNLTE